MTSVSTERIQMWFDYHYAEYGGFPGGSVVKKKKSACNVRDTGDSGSVPGLGRSSGGGHDNPLQYSSWRVTLDRGAWQATVHRVANRRT